MFEYLRRHAVDNVWCSPQQDNQIIMEIKRITKNGGEMISAPVMNSRLSLPINNKRFHVYQIGQLHPTILGLLPNDPDWAIPNWKRFTDAVNSLPLWVDIYTDKGVRVPLTRTYYMYTPDRALVVAVDLSGRTRVNLDQEKLYLRLYTNAYYGTTQGASQSSNTSTQSVSTLQSADILAMQAKVGSIQTLPGETLQYVNGNLVSSIDLISANPGDDIEYIHDTSIKRVVSFPVNSLQQFRSDIDNEYKYLLHCPKAGANEIDFMDDIDVYVVYTYPSGRTIGRLIQRNQAKTFRNVTHGDYSLSISNYEVIATAFVQSISVDPVDIRSLEIRLFIRDSGFTRPLVFDNNRIFELYKLSDDKIVQAMVGANSTMPYWRANVLENSAYVRLMNAKYKDINISLVEEAYGYNAITKILADTPNEVNEVPLGRCAALPVQLYTSATVYEYDSDGLLLGVFHHNSGQNYYPSMSTTAFVEAIEGFGSESPSVLIGTDNLPLPKDYSYRVYMCYVVNGVPNNEWKDITGSEYYDVVDNTLVWKNLENNQWLMVRTDESFLAYTLDLQGVAGTYYFDLTERIGTDLYPMRVPMGSLDIWMNGRSLIENIDYKLDFPRLWIFNKQYLKQPALSNTQNFTIRFTGFCTSDMKPLPVEDYGFVEHGVLSNNSRFDVRDDKVLRITVGGAVRLRKDLLFSENTSGVSVVNALNGAPYQIRDVVIPIRGYTDKETYALRNQSLIIDKAVEDYMSLYYPEPTRNAVSSIQKRHTLYSPFFVHIVNDLLTEDFDMAGLNQQLTDEVVISLCAPYEHLLRNDPLDETLALDAGYITIHPVQTLDPIALPLKSYNFVKRVVELYGRNRITLSTHLTINLGG